MVKMGTSPSGHLREKRPLLFILKEQATILSLGILFIAGVCAGVVVCSLIDAALAENLWMLLGGFVSSRTEQAASATFVSAYLTNQVLLILTVLFGFCAIGSPFIALIPWFKGLGFGVVACGTFILYGYRSVGYIALLLLPNTIISVVALILCCRDALKISVELYRCISPTQRAQTPIKTNGFIARCLLLSILLLMGAALEAFLYLRLGGLFAL